VRGRRQSNAATVALLRVKLLPTPPASWLTTKRLHAHGLILALCLWSVYLWNISTPGLRDGSGNLKGTDFLHLYTLGSLALHHDAADLYNMQAQSVLAAQRVPVAAGIQYLPLYPPQVSIFFAPFARLSYPAALALWLFFSVFIYGICCYAVWKACPSLHGNGIIVLILAIAFPAFWHLIAWGQTSALALACFTLAFLALRNKKDFLAGLAFGCLIFKPQLGLAAAVVFLITGRWKIVCGALLSAVAESTVSVAYYGSDPLRQWIEQLIHVQRVLPLLEPRIYQTHSLRTFWEMLIPWQTFSFTLYAISSMVVCALLLPCWRAKVPLALKYPALLLATVLLAPHLTVYDLVILAPAFLLLSNELLRWQENAQTSNLKLLLYAAYTLPLLGPLARWTHFQLSVPVMAALLWCIWKMGRYGIAPGALSAE
jgi:alpha-1,2-mannosyltransferase